MRVLLRAILAGFGIRDVDGADSIRSATEQFSDISYDLVLVDNHMATGSGLDFVRWARSEDLSPNPYVPIIMISSYAERHRVKEAVNAGVDEFLVKPVKPMDVARRIDSVTYHRRPFIKTEDYFGPCRRRRVNPTYSGPMRRSSDGVETEEDDFVFELE